MIGRRSRATRGSKRTRHLSDWFGGNIDAEAHEEAIGLGPYGKALSILTFEELPDANAADEEEDLIVDSAISALDLPQSD